MAAQENTTRTFANASPYSATIHFDEDLGSNVILLSYTDQTNPARTITVGIAPDLGSNLFLFRVGEHEIVYCERDLLKQRDFTGAFVLWPFPNRMRDKQYTYQGHTYSLKTLKRPGGDDHLVHGIVFDQQWQYEIPVLTQDAVSVTTTFAMTPEHPYYHYYPFESSLSVTYTLTNEGVSVTYNVRNNGSKDMPSGFALHPYLSKLSGDDDTLISVPALAVMEANNELLPTGRVLRVDDGVMYAMFDLRKPRPVGTLNLDHVYMDRDPNARAFVEYKKQAMRLDISATDDFTHMVVFTPPGKEYACIEDQTCSTDAVNLHHRGLQNIAHLQEVHPGETITGTIHYTIAYDR